MKRGILKHGYGLLILVVLASVIAGCSKPTMHTVTYPTVAPSTILATDTLPTFYNPNGVAVDAAGNVYVADYGNNLIRKITPAGLVSTLAGSGNQGPLNGTGVLASFNGPKGIAVDAAGNVYVADSGNQLIRKITAAGVVTTLAGTANTMGAVNGTGTAASFFYPAGLALDTQGNVYVADEGNDLVREITAAGLVSTLAGIDTSSISTGPFDNPTGVAVDGKGNVYVANYLYNTINLVNPAGIISSFAGSGLQGATNGPAATATFYLPNSVAVDAQGNVYVADGINNIIRKINTAGIVSTLAGSGAAGGADSTGTAASFNGPSGIAVDAKGNVYVADSNNNKVRKITPAGVVSTIAGNGNPGAKNGLVFMDDLKRWYGQPYQHLYCTLLF